MNTKDRMKALLCSCCRELQDKNFDFDKNPALSQWWNNHKIEDQEREIAESSDDLQRQLKCNLLKRMLDKDINSISSEEISELYNNGLITAEIYNKLTNK